MKYVEVAIIRKSNNTDYLYTYSCYDDSVTIGSRVLVPFGQGNKVSEGYVFSISTETRLPSSKIKKVLKIFDDEISLTEESIDLCSWMKSTYRCRYSDAIQCFIPAGAAMKKQQYVEFIKDDDSNILKPSDAKLLSFIKKSKSASIKQIVSQLGDNIESRISFLERKGFVKINEKLEHKVSTSFQLYVKISDKEKALNLISNNKAAFRQVQLLEILLGKPQLACADAMKSYGISMATIRSLESKKIVDIFPLENTRTPYLDIEGETKSIQSLTAEQQNAIEYIRPAIEKNIHKPFLIHGVTGSGKTEIYLQLINKAIQQEKNAIVLVPEISLTLQMIERFKGRFGEEHIAVLHSKLSMGERYDEWIRIKRGHVKIVIGARSSLFAPMKHIGVIIIDEEHEPSYKSDHTPKYDTIETARKRAQLNNAVLVLGSATPTITTYHKTVKGEYERIVLNSRYNKVPLPHVEVVDMREELAYGNKSIFSRKLYNEMKDNLKNHKQIMLFLNRRGYASFVSCRSCGFVLKCPSCGISMTYHFNSQSCVCHYCGLERKMPATCPDCNSKYIKYFGVGTEKVEEIVKETFPDVSCERLDLDTSSKKGSTQKILSKFKEGKTDVLVGTQIIAKGLDFPNVGLVGIVAADISLNIADYRSSERTFQLITQAAGRAGRGKEIGKVIIQTYKPEHYAITTATTHDYKGFYQNEITMRKQLEYPPFVDIIQIIISGENEKKVSHLSEKIVAKYLKKMGEAHRHYVLGPRPAPRQKINDRYRFQILIKCKPVDRIQIQGIIDNIKEDFNQSANKGYSMVIDINPYSFM